MLLRRQKKVRFPKGKKVKAPTEPVSIKEKDEEAVPQAQDFSDPRLAAKERARRRTQLTTELFTEDRDVDLAHISSVEVHYQVFLSLFFFMLSPHPPWAYI